VTSGWAFRALVDDELDGRGTEGDETRATGEWPAAVLLAWGTPAQTACIENSSSLATFVSQACANL
jgi:hypothetical protein